MKRIHESLPASSFTRPDGIINRNVCRVSGMLAGPGCINTYSEIFTADNLPAWWNS